MSDARAVVGMDRLPWLMDEPRPQVQAMRGARELLGWAIAGLLVVAVSSYWLGTRVVRPPVESYLSSEPDATVKLPDVRESVEPQTPLVESPETAPTAGASPRVEKPVRRARPAPLTRPKTLSPMDMSGSDLEQTVAEQEGAPAKQAEAASEPTKPAPAVSAPAHPKVAKPQPRLWPATESTGASGRIVRIGSFGSRQQAKLGWRRMQRVYPAVARLPATVVSDRNSHGRVFYRFQIGTTSQAHSEVLCQRMEKMLRFSCAVVGLPWKAKVER